MKNFILPVKLLLTGICLLPFMACENKDIIIEEICDNGRCFNFEQFAENLKTRLNSVSSGYSFAIYYENSLQKCGDRGQARRPKDGDAFDIDAINTDMNVASCAKSITCIAMLQLLEVNNLPLSTKIKDYLPQWWISGPNIDSITFENLLTHNSGFRTAAENYGQIRNVIYNGINITDLNHYDYQNLNFCILRIIIPILNGTFNKDVEVTDATAELQTTKQFMTYLRANIFDPLLIDVSCDNGNNVLYYNYINPYYPSFYPQNECDNAGAGTLSMSASDLCKTMAYAIHTAELLSDTMQSVMFNHTNPLGCYSNNVNFNENWGNHFHHNGGFTKGMGQGARSCWYAFHNGVICAVSTNDAGGIVAGGYNYINDLIELAFDDAWTP